LAVFISQLGWFLAHSFLTFVFLKDCAVKFSLLAVGGKPVAAPDASNPL